MDTPGKRLKWAREHQTKFKAPTEAARAFGWPVSTYLGHENGDRNPSRAAAKRYASRYGVKWEWILEGGGQPFAKARTLRAPVVGYVGGGGNIIPVDDHAIGEGIEEIELPPPLDLVAVAVRGESMYPRYFDGEYLFYSRDGRPPAELINNECVVKLADGRMMVKRLRRGSKKNRFNLESFNAETMEDQELEWAALVKWRASK